MALFIAYALRTSMVLIPIILMLFTGIWIKSVLTPSPSENALDTPAPGESDVIPSPAPDISPPAAADEVYEFGTPLEESESVEDTAFANAVFLGDSRTEGLQLWGGITGGDYLWSRGMTVFAIDDENYTFNVDSEELTMLEALSRKQYDKVYIMIGVNELGYPAASYEQGLGVFIDKVISAQPEAVIYLQTLPPLNDSLARQYLADYETNKNVDAFNEVIFHMAAEKHIVLLDTAEAYRDSAGQLPADLTSDGCHFTTSGYRIWADYLRSHVIDPELYFFSRASVTE